MPGTIKRVPLFDDQGTRNRGKENKEAADVSLAKERISSASDDEGAMIGNGQWLVAPVCSDCVQYCEQGLAKGTLSKSLKVVGSNSVPAISTAESRRVHRSTPLGDA